MVMDIQKLEIMPPPPGVFGSLKAGFDVVSNRVALILLPLGLDLLLWLGPRFSVNDLLSPFFKLAFSQARLGVGTSELDSFVQNQTMIMERLQGYNLLSLLSKLQLFPIGISSLSAQTLPVANPLGIQNVVIVSSAWIMLGLFFVLIPLGWVGGGVYFRQVAGPILGEEEAGVSILRAIAQTILLSVVWVIGLMVVFIPLILILALLTFISPLIANIVALVILFLSFWLVVPLFFTPHGIFVRKQNAFRSIYSSLRMIRFSLPTSGMFVLSTFLLSRGLDVLWSVPKNDSWLALVGFAGHAFITTTLLAGSFVYYRDMTDWLQNVYERFQMVGKKPSSTV
jgi:hypothetical protein